MTENYLGSVNENCPFCQSVLSIDHEFDVLDAKLVKACFNDNCQAEYSHCYYKSNKVLYDRSMIIFLNDKPIDIYFSSKYIIIDHKNKYNSMNIDFTSIKDIQEKIELIMAFE